MPATALSDMRTAVLHSHHVVVTIFSATASG